MRRRSWAVAVIVSGLFAPFAQAITFWDDTSTDLSNTGSTPNGFVLANGTNTLVGSLRTTSTADNRDFLAVTVPSGLALQSFSHIAYNSTDAQGFSGFGAGSTFLDADINTPSKYLGYAHFGTGATNPGVNANAPTTTVGVDLFGSQYMPNNAAGGTAAGAQGFTVPLSAGTYTFLIQQTGTAATSYQFDFVVVPEPATAAALFLCGLNAIGRRRRD
jgi:hypothetical protein